MKTIEVLFTPAEFAGLAGRDLTRTVCVVFDILRATSSIVTALANGAAAVVPALEIPEALARRRAQPGILLAGERGGVRIRAGQTGGADFDFGNSPREFTAAAVQGRTIVTTTTNGTRALRACAGAQEILVGSFLNLGATARAAERLAAAELLLVCSGTGDEAALEDVLAAGAVCDLLLAGDSHARPLDSAQLAREIFRRHEADLPAAMKLSTNGCRLLAQAELRADVGFCLQRDIYDFAARLGRDGQVKRVC